MRLTSSAAVSVGYADFKSEWEKTVNDIHWLHSEHGGWELARIP